MKENYLFYTKGRLSDFLDSKKSEIKTEIYGYDENYLLNVSEEDLVKALVEKHILEPINLKMDEKYLLEPKEIDVDVSGDPNRVIFEFNRGKPFYKKGTSITVVIPFEGDKELFYYQPSTFSLMIPEGIIHGNELHLNYITTEHNSESLKREIDSNVQQIKSYLDCAKSNVDDFNSSLESFIRNLIKTRKEKLLKDRNLVSTLDIPIKKNDNTFGLYSIPIKPQKIKIELPQVKSEKFKPEPTLAMEIYEDILSILQNMALVMERSPKTFSKMKEENLRDHFLVQLNGQYEGQAMGEVFNYQGKTDILIRYENANVFIAECKFWKGEKKFLETVDQLLRYTSWRDTKTAILLFNRTGNLSEVLNKIQGIIEKHSCYKRTIEINKETKFRYILHLPNDPNREIILTIMVFDVPKI